MPDTAAVPPPADTAELVARLDRHRAHGPADSLWGRCTVCGLTWSEQARAIQDEEKTDADA